MNLHRIANSDLSAGIELARIGLMALAETRRKCGRGRAGWVSVPGFSAALAHYDQARAPRLNAALTQGLRDYFGAHTYRRIDDEGAFHINWSTDGTEITAD